MSYNPFAQDPPTASFYASPQTSPNPFDANPAFQPIAETQPNLAFEENVGFARPKDGEGIEHGNHHTSRHSTSSFAIRIAREAPLFITPIVVSVLFCIAIIILSFMQIKDVTKTAQGSYITSLNGGDTCSSLSYNPVRFRFNDDPEYLECGWASKNTALRIIFAVVGTVSPLLILIAFKRGWKWLLYSYALLCVLMATAFFYSMAIDATGVRKSDSWCKDGLAGMLLTPNTEVHCNVWPYVATCLLEVGAILFWLITAIIVARHTKRFIEKNDL